MLTGITIFSELFQVDASFFYVNKKAPQCRGFRNKKGSFRCDSGHCSFGKWTRVTFPCSSSFRSHISDWPNQQFQLILVFWAALVITGMWDIIIEYNAGVCFCKCVLHWSGGWVWHIDVPIGVCGLKNCFWDSSLSGTALAVNKSKECRD